MSVSFDSFFSKFTISLKGSLSHEVEIGADPLGNLQRLSNALEGMTGKMADVEQKLSNVEHQLETAKVEVTKPFAQEQELVEKLERLAELNALLNMDEKGDNVLDMGDDEPAYMSGVQDKMVIAGAMAGLGIVLAVVSFLIYRAGIFVLGFGIGITLSIYLVHPTSSFSFFLCILIGVGLGVLAMRYAKGVIIVGTSILGGVLAGLSIAKIAGLAQFPYGVGMAAGIAILGMLIQFAINKDRYDEEDDEEEDDDDGTLPEETRKPAGRDRRGNSREYTSDRNRDDHRYTYENRANDDRESRGERRSRRPSDREGRNSDRRERNYADSRKRSGS